MKKRQGKYLKLKRREDKTMSIYRVFYSSMTAHYGPSYIEADSENEARQKFGRTAFSQREMALVHATPVSEIEIRRALQRQKEGE
jgi:hypothetical protein